MKYKTVSTGAYPKIGDTLSRQEFRRAYAKWEKKEISDAEFEEICQEVTKGIIEEQESAGLDIVTDGQVRWYDSFTLAKRVPNVETGGLLRFFDTNTYFRQPVVTEKLQLPSDSITLKEFESARKVSQKPLKYVLTGPYTLARGSLLKNNYLFEELVIDYAKVIAKEVEILNQNGAEYIQIDEPWILKYSEDFPLFIEAFSLIYNAKKSAEITAFFYFDNIVPFFSSLLEFPCDVLGLDITYSKELQSKIKEVRPSKPICFGLIDARNTYREKKEDIYPFLDEVMDSINSEIVYFGPSASLEYLPRKRAYEKLENMVFLLKGYFK